MCASRCLACPTFTSEIRVGLCLRFAAYGSYTVQNEETCSTGGICRFYDLDPNPETPFEQHMLSSSQPSLLGSLELHETFSIYQAIWALKST